MRGLRFMFVSVLIVSSGAFWALARPALAGGPAATAEPALAQAAAAPAPVQGRGGRGGRGRGAQPRVRKAVLAWADTRNGVAQHESVSHALAIIARLGYESGAYDTFIRTDSHIISKSPTKTDGSPASGGPNLNNVDAIFFMGHREVPIDDKQKADLLSFVRDDGKGFVAAHVGLTAFESWPEFGELIGARFDGHPVVGPGVVINEDPSFPATRHLPASFPFNDEFYQAKEFSRDKIHVLLRLDLTGVNNPGISNPNRDYPLAWAKTYGKGRVFFGSFAHSNATWDVADIQRMYYEAIKWSLGMSDADLAPHPMRGETR